MWLPGSLACRRASGQLGHHHILSHGTSEPPRSLFKGKASTGIIHLQKHADLAVICGGTCEHLTPVAGHSPPLIPRPPRRVCRSSARWTINWSRVDSVVSYRFSPVTAPSAVSFPAAWFPVWKCKAHMSFDGAEKLRLPTPTDFLLLLRTVRSRAGC